MEDFAEFESLIGIISEIPDESVEEESTEESPSVSEAVAKEDTKVSGEASNPLKTNED